MFGDDDTPDGVWHGYRYRILTAQGPSAPGGEYGYLIYPQRPIVGYDARSGEPLSEYCVRFRDGSEPEAGERLPDADDVLAKWLALQMDEAHTMGTANVHPLGRQLDPAMVRRDLAALQNWKATA